MKPKQGVSPSQPARDFELEGGHGIGLITSVTEPFCEACNRMRLTADGAVRNCLFSNQEYSVRDPMRSGATDDEILEVFRTAIAAKAAGHGIDEDGFQPPDRPMYSIGG